MQLIGKGAEADIFSTTLFGKGLLVKIRNPKPYRIKELDLSIRKTRTKREAKAMYKASKVGVNAPRLIAIGKFSIYMERITGKMLKDTNPTAKIYQMLGMQLGLMHKAEIAHGDFTPANVIVSGGKPWIIDFGLSEITRSTEEKALDLLLMKRSISKSNYSAFIGAYQKSCPSAKEMLKRLYEIEERGRYKIRTLE